MKSILSTILLLAIAFTAQAQAVSEYSVECRESGAYLTTPSDSRGIELDTMQIKSDLAAIDVELEDLAIQEAQLQLLAKKRQLETRKSFLSNLQKKIKESCEQ